MPVLSQPVLDLIRHLCDSYITLQYHKIYCTDTSIISVTLIVIVVLILRKIPD